MSAPLLLIDTFINVGTFRKDWFGSVVVYHVTQQQTRMLHTDSSSFRGKYPSCRGEGGDEWLGGPLWSPAVPLKDIDASHMQHINQPERNQQEETQTDHCDCRVNQWSAHQAATHP